MKVTVISKGSPDYLIDIVTDGLIRLLGRQNICLDYNVRRPGGQYSTFYEKFDVQDSFNIHDADLLVASVRSIGAAKQWMSKTGKKKVAIIDGEDFDPINESQSWAKVYCKREYLKGKTYPSNVIPLPFAAIPEPLPPYIDVQHPIFFKMAGSDFYRSLVVKTLVGMGFSMPDKRLEKAEYNRMLMSSLVGVSARGQGWDTYRYWETAYFGVALLSQRLNIVIPKDFVDGEEVILWDDLDDLKDKALKLVADPDRARSIGSASRTACLRNHLSTHRAQVVMEALA